MKFENNDNYFKFSLFFLVTFCGFFSIKLGFSPIYLTFFVAVAFFLNAMFSKVAFLQIKWDVLGAIALIVYITISYCYVWNYDGFSPSALINLVFSLLYFLTTKFVLINSSRRSVYKASYYFIAFSFVLLGLELMVRILNPSTSEELGHYDRDDLFWYVYKSNSFMFQDSNTIGLFASTIFCFILQVSRLYLKRLSLFLLPFFIIVLGSISRASIVTTVIIYIFYLSNNYKWRFLYCTLLVLLGVSVLFYFRFGDESIIARFFIADLVAQYLGEANLLMLMLGVGPGGAERALGVGSHLLSFTLLVEIGLVGTLLHVFLWYSIYHCSHGKAGVLIFSLFINGLSFTTFAIPWFYTMCAILIYFSGARKHGENATSVNPDASIQRRKVRARGGSEPTKPNLFEY